MDIENPLIISYSGSLDAYNPVRANRFLKLLKNWFWTYKHNTVDASTRSAYYLIKAVGILKNQYGVGPEALQINLWGQINPLNEVQAKKEDVSAFFSFAGYMPKPGSLKRLSESDMLFLPLEKSNVKGRGTLFIPGKLFEYLHSGKPVLALCEASDCRDILIRSGLGICVEPDKPELIAEKLYEYIRNKSLLLELKPDWEYISGYSFRSKTAELAAIFRKLDVD